MPFWGLHVYQSDYFVWLPAIAPHYPGRFLQCGSRSTLMSKMSQTTTLRLRKARPPFLKVFRVARSNSRMHTAIFAIHTGQKDERHPAPVPAAAGQRLLHSPQADDAQKTRSRHGNQEPVPFPHQVCCHAQQHVPYAPGDAGQDRRVGAVVCVHPLHPCKREAAFSWVTQGFSRRGSAGLCGKGKVKQHPCSFPPAEFHWYLPFLNVHPRVNSWQSWKQLKWSFKGRNSGHILKHPRWYVFILFNSIQWSSSSN